MSKKQRQPVGIDGITRTQPRSEAERRKELLARKAAYGAISPANLVAGLVLLSVDTRYQERNDR